MIELPSVSVTELSLCYVISVQYMYFVVPVYMYTGTVIYVQYMHFVVPVYMYTGTVIYV